MNARPRRWLFHLRYWAWYRWFGIPSRYLSDALPFIITEFRAMREYEGTFRSTLAADDEEHSP